MERTFRLRDLIWPLAAMAVVVYGMAAWLGPESPPRTVASYEGFVATKGWTVENAWADGIKARWLEGEPGAAYRTATNFISGLLKAPATARFSSKKESVILGERSRFRIQGHVDAQNGFGALIRQDWDMVLERRTDEARWRVVGLNMRER